MKPTFYCSFLLLLFCLHLNQALAQQSIAAWERIDRAEVERIENNMAEDMPMRYQVFRMNDIAQFKASMISAPLRFSKEAQRNQVRIQLPLPDGNFCDFMLTNSPVMQDELAASYPALQTYTAIGAENKKLHAKIEMTPKGLFAMITGSKKGTFYVHPLDVKNDIYYSFYKIDASNLQMPFQCGVEDMIDGSEITSAVTRSKNTDCQFRQYRLALACTGEYGQLIDDGDDSNGDAVADVLADMVIIVNRVNGIFEREVGLTMVIVDENEDIIFTDPTTDLYSNVMSSLPAENATAMQVFLGNDKFDIGHVLSSVGGGQAFVNGPCVGRKAAGASGIRGRTGDLFAAYVIAHEMAHQFGGRHTQGNDCNRNESSSYEPGSGSTILSYAGICPPSVQNVADDYFHAISIQQMREFIIDGGSECPVFLETNNLPPVVDAGLDYLIPSSTPFLLEGQATDPEGDPLTYSWEQYDKEFTTHPPSPLSTQGPAIRSFPPTSESIRYIPRLSVLRGEETNRWEVLPEVSRDLNFRLTARGNNGVYGCTSEDDMLVSSIESAGPFVVTAPNNSETWSVGEMELISWNVANTNLSPINCNFVDIYYSADGGMSFPFLFIENVPNTGLYEFEVPQMPDGPIRFMVRGSDNIFFNIAPVDVFITGGVSSVYNETNQETRISILPNPARDVIQIDLLFHTSFKGELRLFNLMGQQFQRLPFYAENTYSEKLSLMGMPAGMYVVKVVGDNGSESVEKFLKY